MTKSPHTKPYHNHQRNPSTISVPTLGTAKVSNIIVPRRNCNSLLIQLKQ